MLRVSPVKIYDGKGNLKRILTSDEVYQNSIDHELLPYINCNMIQNITVYRAFSTKSGPVNISPDRL